MGIAFKKAVPPPFRPIAGYEGFYEVCTFGVVRRIKPWKSRTASGFIRPSVTTHGYCNVSLCRDNKPHSFRLHKLVAEAFLGPCPKGKTINHKDGDKTNNRLENLEYITPKENTAHAIRIGLFNPRKNQEK